MSKDLSILLWCALLAALAGLAAVVLDRPEGSLDAAAYQHIPPKITTVPISPGEIEGHAAVLVDANTGDVLFEKNAQTQWPLASLTKIATALAVLSQGENRFVTIRREDVATTGDSGLCAGDVWALKDLVAFGLTTSSNDAMSAAAQVLTNEGTLMRMNTAAAADGLRQSYFLNPTGLDVSPSTAGAYGSAVDVAVLTKKLLREHPAVFEATALPPRANGMSGKDAVSTLTPMWRMPGFIAGKTGYTDLAGGNLSAVVDIGMGQPVIAVVLGSTEDGRFRDVERMIQAAREAQIQKAKETE